MKIAIIGAGVTGLTTAYRLSQKGHQVTLFEKENYTGGLVAGSKKKNWNWHLEHFFHHLFTSDNAAKNLISKLGLSNKLFYCRPKTSIYFNGKISQFDSPISLLFFPYFSFPEKLRIGIITSYLKLMTPPRHPGHLGGKPRTSLEHLQGEPKGEQWKFEKITASTWLKKHYSQKPYQILWQPLLEAKFGKETDKISLAWFWARIKKRSTRLGYLKGGFQILVDKLTEEIKNHGGKIHLNHEIFHFDDLDDRSETDRFIFTVPTSTFLKIMGNQLPINSQHHLQKLKMLGALNLILVLKEKFLTNGTYWLNINEKNFPFVAVVEHTNFIDFKHYGGNHILYVGGYYPQNHRYFKMSKEKIFKEFLPYLRRINSEFNSLFIIHYSLFKSPHAQPIIPTNYSKIIPEMKTPIPKVYLANMQMVYPWDRGINYAIELGEKVANEVFKTEKFIAPRTVSG